jgi:hypothetical protein
MSIYTYFFFSYGLTAVIALFMVCVIVLTNKVMHALHTDTDNGKTNDTKEM